MCLHVHVNICNTHGCVGISGVELLVLLPPLIQKRGKYFLLVVRPFSLVELVQELAQILVKGQNKQQDIWKYSNNFGIVHM